MIMKKMMKRFAAFAMAAVLSVGMLAGCGNGGSGASKSSNPAITLNGASVSMEAANFYTYIMKSQYEAYYGTQIWDMEIEEGVTFGDSLKEMVNDALVQMLILNSKAEEYGVSLTSEDKTEIAEYIDNFKANVGEDVMKEEGITEAVIEEVVGMNNIARHVYDAMMLDEEVKLSDEDKANAACIRVQHILITTMDTVKEDADGNKVDMTEDEAAAYKAQQKTLAESVLAKAKNGEDFQKLADEYTAENAGFEFAFNNTGYDPVNGTSMVEEFYTASWELGEGEISGLVETQYGYHIIKCVSLNDETATNAAITQMENELKYISLDERLLQMTEEAEYTVSDSWKEYKIVSDVVDETTVETTVETQAQSVNETEE